MTDQTLTMPRFYKPEEVADAMGVAYGTVLAWIRSGKLPALAIGASKDGTPRAPYRITDEQLATLTAALSTAPDAVITSPPARVEELEAPAPKRTSTRRRKRVALVAP